MLHQVQSIFDMRISNSVDNYDEPLETEYIRKCLLVAGPGLGMPVCQGSNNHSPSYFRKLLDEIVAWCIREKVIIQPPVIEDLRRLILYWLLGSSVPKKPFETENNRHLLLANTGGWCSD